VVSRGPPDGTPRATELQGGVLPPAPPALTSAGPADRSRIALAERPVLRASAWLGRLRRGSTAVSTVSPFFGREGVTVGSA
jgi:hypothetical protein